jgi:hypothetical protein
MLLWLGKNQLRKEVLASTFFTLGSANSGEIAAGVGID